MKKVISIVITALLLLSLGTTAFAESNGNPAINEKGIIRAFDESLFSGMDISYTDSGAPVVDDPNAKIENIVQGKGVITAKSCGNIWIYRDRRLNNELFIIPAGKTVIVLQTDTNCGSAQITYAGVTGWVYGSNLSLG